jgi:methionyl-tRNA formyltransferase
VAAYGHILPKDILDLPRFGCVNVHTSLLPKYRGAAPIQWAILNGETETGVTIMKMDAGMDTGAILAQAATPISPEDNSQTLHDRLARMGADLLVATLRDSATGRIQPRAQPAEGVSYAPKIKKQDGQIHWEQPAASIWNRVRAMIPWPGAFTFLQGEPQAHLLKIWQAEVTSPREILSCAPCGGGQRVISRGEGTGAPGEVLRADKAGVVVACGSDALRILGLQREGGRRMSAQEFLAGHLLTPGQKLG